MYDFISSFVIQDSAFQDQHKRNCFLHKIINNYSDCIREFLKCLEDGKLKNKNRFAFFVVVFFPWDTKINDTVELELPEGKYSSTLKP